MKNERVFSKSGFYNSVLRSNALLHEEAATVGSEIVSTWLKDCRNAKLLKVIDLACGSEPYTVFNIIASLEGIEVEYTGVDVNPDQVSSLRGSGGTPKNIVRSRVMEGDVWRLDELSFGDRFDMAFVGLNLHHGAPGQLNKLFRDVHFLLSEGGLFLNHDFFRPARFPYVAPGCGDKASDWRPEFVRALEAYLRKRLGNEEGIAQNSEHIMNCDYPLSVAEMVELMRHGAFRAKAHEFSSYDHKLREYFAMVEGVRAAE